MKKILILACVFLLSFSTIFASSASAASLFKDVPETSPYYKDLKFLYDRGLMQYDNPEGMLFSGDAKRYSVVVMFSKILGIPHFPAKTPYSDILEFDLLSGQVVVLSELGVVNGYSDGTFKPYNLLTRGNFALFVDRAFGKYLPSGNQEFSDVPKSSEAYNAVKKLVAAGITTGYNDGTFKPNEKLSFVHLHVFMARLVRYLESQNIKVPLNVGSLEDTNTKPQKPIDDSKIKLGMTKAEVYELIKSQIYKNITVDSEVLLTTSGRNGLAGETMYGFSNNKLVSISTHFDLDSLEIEPNTVGELHEYYVNELAKEFGQSYKTYTNNHLLTSWEKYNYEVILLTSKGKNGVTVSLSISSIGK